jgi:myo-inositol-1(or 4)-monophosphatase
MSPELETAILAARQAGELLRGNQNQFAHFRHKSAMEIVTDLDLQAEALIAERLAAAFPNYGFVGEEGTGARSESGRNWIVDPIDGTMNFVRGYPAFAVSIALEQNREILVGAVYNPVLDELFTAEKGKGAALNGAPLRASAVREINQALVASGFPYDAWTLAADNVAGWGKLVKRALSMRSDGVAALDLCYVAAGRLDAYWEIDLAPWDMAAGAIVVQEAGGMVTTVSGEPFTLSERSILETNGQLHPAMLRILESA